MKRMFYKPEVSLSDATVDLLELVEKSGKVRNLRMCTADRGANQQPEETQDNKRLK